jgi:hypothetical protein
LVYLACGAVILTIICLSVIAAAKLSVADRLPMQWGLNGKVT